MLAPVHAAAPVAACGLRRWTFQHLTRNSRLSQELWFTLMGHQAHKLIKTKA